MGATITIGHSSKNIGKADVVVVSTAVREDNPEVVEARSQLIPVIPRAQMLAELMRMKYAICVAGTHGKTTTTSMAAVTLTKGGFDPTIVIGGRVDRFGSGAKLGKGEFLIAEADESDGSFLRLYPTISVVTNIDVEHLDHYGNFDSLKKAFTEFINKTPFYGSSILCLDDESVREILPNVEKRFWTYGITSDADVVASDLSFDEFKSSFSVNVSGKDLGRLTIGMPGVHNIYNALAAMAVGLELDMDPQEVIESLNGFAGIQRRLQFKGEIDGVMVLDDYGHHPTEIKATLCAIKEGFSDRRLIVVFQPHRYTRTRDLLTEFGVAFNDADDLVITEIYAASEQPIEGISGELIMKEIAYNGQKRVNFAKTNEDALQYLKENALEGDIILTLGAGDVLQVGHKYLSMTSNI